MPPASPARSESRGTFLLICLAYHLRWGSARVRAEKLSALPRPHVGLGRAGRGMVRPAHVRPDQLEHGRARPRGEAGAGPAARTKRGYWGACGCYTRPDGHRPGLGRARPCGRQDARPFAIAASFDCPPQMRDGLLRQARRRCRVCSDVAASRAGTAVREAKRRGPTLSHAWLKRTQP
jgi:hypothetical protein